MSGGKLYKETKKRLSGGAGQPKADMFTLLCLSDLKVECVREYRFHPVRKWRFDYAIPSHKVALEVEGGVWTGGRHTRGAGFMGDMEKYNQAALMGWKVLRTTPERLYSRETLDMIAQAVK